MSARRVPVTVLTGFLGSGKTTLLRRLLERDELGDTAILINELGAVAIDHALVRHVEENIAVLASGCLCCTVRDDLGKALRDLLARRGRGELSFRRVMIETTGLADPVPILHTLMTDPVLDTAVRIASVATTVDAISGGLHLDRQAEAIRQVAVADILVLTKTDMAAAGDPAPLADRLRRINPLATILTAGDPGFEPIALLADGAWDAARLASDAVRWLHHLPAGGATHDEAIAASSFVVEQPLDWTGFGVWLTMLLHRHGAAILRVKALLNVADEPGPVAVHGVQHVIHPPVHLATWPDDDRRSRLVFITRGISGEALAASLTVFSRAAAAARGVASDPVMLIPVNGTEIGGRPIRRAAGLACMKLPMLAGRPMRGSGG